MKVVGLIPARGGSKEVPRKNIRLLAGKSLVQRTFECAVASASLDRIILSTDDEEIAESAKGFGLEVPFIRDARLAQDDTAMIDVVIDALVQIGSDGYHADVVLLLQPTSPLRRPDHIRRALELLGENDSVCSVVPVPRNLCPHYLMKIDEQGRLKYFLPEGEKVTRRQDVPEAYKRDGTIFLARTELVSNYRTLYGARCVPMILDSSETMSVDTPLEWTHAEEYLKRADS